MSNQPQPPPALCEDFLSGGGGGNNKEELDSAHGTNAHQRAFARMCSILADPNTDHDTIRLTTRRGLPDELRADFWRLLLGVTPLGEPSKRDKTLVSLKDQYENLLTITCKDIKDGEAPEPGVDPFPIDADVPRTMPTLHFFASQVHSSSSPTSATSSSSSSATSAASAFVEQKQSAPASAFPTGESPERKEKHQEEGGGGGGDENQESKKQQQISVEGTGATVAGGGGKGHHHNNHHENYTPTQQALRRILFLFSRVHKGRGYSQGMNEMVGLLIWALSNGNASMVPDIESDVFFCFQSLMQWCGEHFSTHVDHEGGSGLGNTLKSFSFLFKLCDPELHAHLEEDHQVVPEFFAFRWIAILFVLEFPVADVLSLWDFLLSFTERISIACMFTAVAMLILIREKLLELDQSGCIEMLQSYPPVDVQDVIATATALIDRHTVSPHLWGEKQQKKKSSSSNNNNNNSSSSSSPTSSAGGEGSGEEESSFKEKASAAFSWFKKKAAELSEKVNSPTVNETQQQQQQQQQAPSQPQQQQQQQKEQQAPPPPPPKTLQNQAIVEEDEKKAECVELEDKFF